MVIILEGPDGHGKSVLSGQLQKFFKYESVHFKGPKHILKSVSSFLEPCFYPFFNDNVIIDRYTPISEIIYGLNLRGKTKLPLPILYLFIKFVPATIIYCRTGKQILHLRTKSYKTKAHIAEVESKGDRILLSYEDLFSKVKCIKYDYQKDNFQKLLSKILTGRNK